MQKMLAFVVIAIILIILFYLYQRIITGKVAENKENAEKTKICFKEHCFQVELAKNFSQRARGLMNRKKLDKNKGMFFIFTYEARHSFWMKNMPIPLDIIWINKDKEVVFIKKNALPCKKIICQSITPDKKALYVLELNAGMADKIGLEIGDKAEFDIS